MANKKSSYTPLPTPEPTNEPVAPKGSYKDWILVGLILAVFISLATYYFHPPLEHWTVKAIGDGSVQFANGQIKVVKFTESPRMEVDSTWELDVRKARYEGSPNVATYRLYGARRLSGTGPKCHEERVHSNDIGDMAIYWVCE